MRHTPTAAGSASPTSLAALQHIAKRGRGRPRLEPEPPEPEAEPVDPWTEPSAYGAPIPPEEPPFIGAPEPRQPGPPGPTSEAFIRRLKMEYGPKSACPDARRIGLEDEVQTWLDGLVAKPTPVKGHAKAKAKAEPKPKCKPRNYAKGRKRKKATR